MHTISNACQPGFNASCALYWESHNYNAVYHEIDNLFKERFYYFNTFISTNNIHSPLPACCNALEQITLPPCDDDATHCAFVAYIDTSFTTIGCLLYPHCYKFDYRSLYIGSICKTFNCKVNTPAYYDTVITAATIFRDWYYYSIAIHTTALFNNIHRMCII